MAVEKILVTGANGQLGTVLIPYLCEIFGEKNVLATDVRAGITHACRFELLDVMDPKALALLIDRFQITQVYHLAAVLSAKGEADPLRTWNMNTGTFLNVLETARIRDLKKIFFPSSIAVFGQGTEQQYARQHERLVPTTAYGISKAASEIWAAYYFDRYQLDIRSLRYPGVIGHQSSPGGGTTDYAVEIFHQAVRGKSFTCFLAPKTTIPMIYMDDAIRATLQLMEAPASQIKIRTSYNLAGVSFCPDQLVEEIRRVFPHFEVNYQPDFRQAIAASWPAYIDDTPARQEWGWVPHFDLPKIAEDMIVNLKRKYEGEPGREKLALSS